MKIKFWEPGMSLEEVKLRAVEDALNHYKGNRKHTAKALGISVRCLRYLVNYVWKDKLQLTYLNPPKAAESVVKVDEK
jgi:DNA-binding NtrC family response regulator